MDVATACGITLIEDEIDHGGHGAEPLGAFGRARRLEWNVGLCDAVFGTGDALLHGAVTDQERACNFLHCQAGNNAERQRDLLHRRKIGMAANKQQAQHVVAVMGIVEPLDQIGLSIVEIGDRIVRRQRLASSVFADVVERVIAPDHDEPRHGIARRPVHRPILQRPQACFLECFFGPIEIAKITQQCADNFRPRRA